MPEKEGLGFLTTSGVWWDLRPPFPGSYLSLHWHVSHWLELAGEENKQITRKQTQRLISMKWNEENVFSSMRAQWASGKEGQGIIFSLSPLSSVFAFPSNFILSRCPLCPPVTRQWASPSRSFLSMGSARQMGGWWIWRDRQQGDGWLAGW